MKNNSHKKSLTNSYYIIFIIIPAYYTGDETLFYNSKIISEYLTMKNKLKNENSLYQSVYRSLK